MMLWFFPFHDESRRTTIVPHDRASGIITADRGWRQYQSLRASPDIAISTTSLNGNRPRISLTPRRSHAPFAVDPMLHSQRSIPRSTSRKVIVGKGLQLARTFQPHIPNRFLSRTCIGCWISFVSSTADCSPHAHSQQTATGDSYQALPRVSAC